MKKILAMVLLCLFAISVMSVTLIGCDKQNSTDGTSAETGNTAESKAITTASMKEEYKPKIDTLVIYGPNRVLPDENPTKAWMQEQLGIKLNFITVMDRNEYKTKLNLLIASNEIPDIITDQEDGEYYKHVEEGLFIDMEQLLEDYAPNVLKAREPENFEALRWKDGKQYVVSNNVNPGYEGLLIRNDWLKKLGLSVPTTLDEFAEVCRAFIEDDPDGNGVNDTIGFAGWNPSVEIKGFNPIFGAYGANPYAWILKDGKVVHGAIQNETKEAIKYISKLFSEGLVNKEYLLTDRAKLNEKVGSGKIGLVCDQMWYVAKTYSIYHPTPEADWLVIAPPKGPEGKSGIVVRSNPIASGYTGITRACKDSVTAVKFLNFIADLDNHLRIRSGIEGEHYNIIDGKFVMADKYVKDNSLLLQEGIAPTYVSAFFPEDPPSKTQPDYMNEFKKLLRSTQTVNGMVFLSVPEIDENLVGKGWEDYYSQCINDMIMAGGNIDEKFDDMVKTIYDKYNMQQQEELAKEFYNEMNGEKLK